MPLLVRVRNGKIAGGLSLQFSDDYLLLAPSLDAFQEMLRVCEDCASSHNLIFSTDKDPPKADRTPKWSYSRKVPYLADSKLEKAGLNISPSGHLS